MTDEREAIFQEIDHKRDYQDAKWGGIDHDDTRESEGTFERYIAEYAQKTSVRTASKPHRARMIDIAALAVAAIERYDRLNPKVPKDADVKAVG